MILEHNTVLFVAYVTVMSMVNRVVGHFFSMHLDRLVNCGGLPSSTHGFEGHLRLSSF
jgi:hypothetical protein